jgi:hypothetical protein
MIGDWWFLSSSKVISISSFVPKNPATSMLMIDFANTTLPLRLQLPADRE